MCTGRLFLHLSDIHFNRPGDPRYLDYDARLRDELERDAHEFVSASRQLDGILISGDIAFSGDPGQYQKARHWLNSLCQKLSCEKHLVWAVPGNHDVDRNIIDGSDLIRTYHEKLGRISIPKLDDCLASILRDNESKPLLYRSIEAYNSEFARAYSCESLPSAPNWTADLSLRDGIKLRLYGINSALISSAADDQDRSKLVVGSFQLSGIRRENNVAYLALCHHPTDWLRDCVGMEDILCKMAHIQLFGHKHDLRIRRIDDTVRVVAGATHPDRRENNWKPCYNFIEVDVEYSEGETFLAVAIHPRVWSDEKQIFCGETQEDNETFMAFKLPLPSGSGRVPDPSQSTSVSRTDDSEDVVEDSADVQGEEEVKSPRRKVYEFMSLPYRIRVSIVQDLGLIEDADEKLDSSLLLEQYFKRASQGRQLTKMFEQIDLEYSRLADSESSGLP